jgi:RND family efflux transporter MFP subunit
MQPPDETSRHEDARVSGEVVPGTDLRVRRAALLLAAVLLGGFVIVKAVRLFEDHRLASATAERSNAPPPVDVTVVKSASAGQELLLPGQTAAWFEATLYGRVNGYVAHWSADIGDRVHKGQVLAVLETPDLDAQLAAARAELQAAEAQATARKAEARFSQSTNERWRDSPKGVVSDQERESKQADFDSAEARLYAANAEVALDRAKVDQFAAMAQYKQVVAPFDGVVAERRIDVGNLVTAGSGGTTSPLYRVVQNDPLRIYVDVPQSAAQDLARAGIQAQIHLADGALINGKVARSADALSAQARTMRVEVDIPNAERALLPGMYVNVGFHLPPKGAVLVPAAALIYRPGSTQVARVDADGKVHFSEVIIARDDGSLVELSAGAKAGDRLVLNISSQIGAGQTVRVDAEAANGKSP